MILSPSPSDFSIPYQVDLVISSGNKVGIGTIIRVIQTGTEDVIFTGQVTRVMQHDDSDDVSFLCRRLQ